MRGHVDRVRLGPGRQGGGQRSVASRRASVVVVDIDRARSPASRTRPSSATPPSTTPSSSAGIDPRRRRSWRALSKATPRTCSSRSRAAPSTAQLFIVARARQDASIAKLSNAGADRVVNPQELGAARMASFVARPHVAEFVDVVMHERSMEFRHAGDRGACRIVPRRPVTFASPTSAEPRQRPRAGAAASRRHVRHQPRPRPRARARTGPHRGRERAACSSAWTRTICTDGVRPAPSSALRVGRRARSQHSMADAGTHAEAHVNYPCVGGCTRGDST